MLYRTLLRKAGLGVSRNYSQSAKKNTAQSCLETVRKRDYEHFLATLLLPKSVQVMAMTIRALNVEVASVRDAVKDTNTGLIRLQFWLDAVSAIESGGKVPNHPVLQQLNSYRPQLDCQLLIDVVESKKVFFTDQPFKTMEDVERYSKQSFSNINVLILKALSIAKADSNNLSGKNV